MSGIEFDHVGDGRIDEAWVGYHPFAERMPALDGTGQGLALMHRAFPDLRRTEVDSVKEGDKPARLPSTGTNST